MVEGTSTIPIASINPATGETLRTFEPLSPSQKSNANSRERPATYRTWRAHNVCRAQARLLFAAADILENEKTAVRPHHDRRDGQNRSKPLATRPPNALGACRYYAENAEQFLRDEQVAIEGGTSYVAYQPIGPVLAVMPWNFPFWQVFRFAAPALMAGNVGLLKHASNVPQCALAIEDIFRRAGFPEGAFQTLLIGSGHVPRVIDDPRVMAVTLTGSEPAGRQVAAQAGRADQEDRARTRRQRSVHRHAQRRIWHAAIATAVKARTINNGQSCIAAKRFIVAEAIAAEFEQRLRCRHAGAEDRRSDGRDGRRRPAGHAADSGRPGQAGAKIRRRRSARSDWRQTARPAGQLLRAHGARGYSRGTLRPIARSCSARWRRCFACRISTPPSAWPTIRTSVWARASGPTTSRSATASFDDIEAGLVFVNGMTASDPRLPFGGVKASGYGRELSSYGIREFVNIKTVCIKYKSKDAHRRGAETLRCHETSARSALTLLQFSYMFKGLEHTAIASPDPGKLAHWYVDHLGFIINFTYDGNYFVKAANGTMLEIIPSEGAPAPQKMKDPGIRHLAIQVDDFDSGPRATQATWRQIPHRAV